MLAARGDLVKSIGRQVAERAIADSRFPATNLRSQTTGSAACRHTSRSRPVESDNYGRPSNGSSW